MRKLPPDYVAIERRMWLDNLNKVNSRLRTEEPNLSKRIATFIERFGFSTQAVQEKISSDGMFAANFAMEPRRQGIHEVAAAQWIREFSEVVDFVVLPKSGKNALYVTSDGYIQTKTPIGKSLDFRWRVEDKQFYAAHKYTKESGGNQDSQYYEMRALLERFQRGAEATSVVLVVIVDGPYYTTLKMDNLRRVARAQDPRSYVIPIEELPDLFPQKKP